MYKTLNQHNHEKFGCKVYKLSIDGGFTCPNRDGTKGTGGCIFCSAFGSGEFASPKTDTIEAQLETAKLRVESKNKGGKYIAYFQSFSNTYAPVDVLEKMYLEAIKPDYIVGLSIATRPDCIDENVIELLKKINCIKPVSVELGLQTSNEKSGEFINRKYTNEDYIRSMKMLKDAKIETVTHIILGLPLECEDDMLSTTKFAVDNKTDGVKFHLLHVLKNTKLCEIYEKGEFETLSLERYAEILKKCISLLPKDTVVHRITGDGDKKTLVAPLWSADKKFALNFLNKYLSE
ncbi:MAG: TIGR01212 family radical SAM protein [Clostridia bacterium]|nr:TIGR01212 family radical SAM protein [Clostridia bacterium]